MPHVGFEPTISADEWPQTYALDCTATGTGTLHTSILVYFNSIQRTFIFFHNFQELFPENCKPSKFMDSSRKQPADFLHVQELRSLMGRQRRELFMLDEHGKLKYPTKFRRVQEEYEDTLPTPGTLKQCVSFTFLYHI